MPVVVVAAVEVAVVEVEVAVVEVVREMVAREVAEVVVAQLPEAVPLQHHTPIHRRIRAPTHRHRNMHKRPRNTQLLRRRLCIRKARRRHNITNSRHPPISILMRTHRARALAVHRARTQYVTP
jgi:hypothetical protein